MGGAIARLGIVAIAVKWRDATAMAIATAVAHVIAWTGPASATQVLVALDVKVILTPPCIFH